MNLTPQQFDLVCRMLEAAGRAGYMVGREDQKTNCSIKDEEFTLDAGKRLMLKKELNKTSKSR